MNRRLFKLAAAVSLIVCVAMVAMWVWSISRWLSLSYSRASTLDGHYATALWMVAYSDGQIRLDLIYIRGVLGRGVGWSLEADPHPFSWYGVARGFWHAKLFSRTTRAPDGSTSMRYYSIRMPCWPLLLALSIPADFALIQLVRSRRAQRRAAEQRCTACGYDLRATPQRCPECGMAAAVPK